MEGVEYQISFGEWIEAFSKNKRRSAIMTRWEELYKNPELLHSEYDTALNQTPPFRVITQSTIDGVDAELITSFIESHFRNNLVNRALVNELILDGEVSSASVPADNSFGISADKYLPPSKELDSMMTQESPAQQNELRGYIRRGASMADFRTIPGTTTFGKYFSSPIVLFNQDLDHVNSGLRHDADPDNLGVGYLNAFPKERRRQIYILSTVSHEIGHHLWSYFIQGKPAESEFREIIDRTGSITPYAAKHGQHGAPDYSENFAEAVRIYTTNKAFLSAEVVKFFLSHIPDLQ